MAKTDSTGSFSKAGTRDTEWIPEGTYKVGVNVVHGDWWTVRSQEATPCPPKFCSIRK